MIIGAALVVDELRKGQRLAFRYPASVPSAILNSHPSLLAFHQDYLSLSPDNFAKIFRPKAALFNKIFELTIDDVHYISYPCPCVEKGEENSIDSNNLPSNNDVIVVVSSVSFVSLFDCIDCIDCIDNFEYDSSVLNIIATCLLT